MSWHGPMGQLEVSRRCQEPRGSPSRLSPCPGRSGPGGGRFGAGNGWGARRAGETRLSVGVSSRAAEDQDLERRAQLGA